MGVYVDKEFRVKRVPLKLAASLLSPIKLKMAVKTINATFRNVYQLSASREVVVKTQEVRLPGRSSETVLTI